LILAMRSSPCYQLSLSDDERVKLLLEDYDFFVKDPALFCNRLSALSALRGQQVVAQWQTQVMAGNVESVVRDLLTLHYDPAYFTSMKRNFLQISNATLLQAASRSDLAMDAVAEQLLAN